MVIKNSKILFLSPHPDDIEMGCGGTIKKLLDYNNDVYCAVFSNCDESLPNGFQKGDIIKECYDSLGSLGVDKNKIFIYDYKVRKFSYSRQEILDDMILLKKTIIPDYVFTPSTNDYHQDHLTISIESIRGFKNTSSILCYEQVWNNFLFKNQLFISLSETHLNSKIEAISKYKSQKNRIYTSRDFLKSLAIVRGTQNYTDYAESFEIIKIKL